jgi:Kef-type K+ transport system membrane component KefB
MCLSAIPVITKTLADMGLLHRDVGQLTLAAGLIDDAVGWFLLAVLVGRPTVTVAMRLASRLSEDGPVIAAAVLVVLVDAVSTQALGMEPSFGAFIAGILVAASGVNRSRLAGLRAVVMSVLAPIFLTTAGIGSI